MLFGAALPNFGVRRLLDAVISFAPPPSAREDVKGEARPVDAPFSGLVFKVQANMDPAHRDRMAFVRVCSGRFERGMVLTHAATGRPFATKYAQSMFGQDRETVEEAFPGDVIGLVNATALRPGDTLYAGVPVEFPPIPSFAPEHFAVVRCKDAGKFKQFRRGIAQLDEEGVVQVLRDRDLGDQAPMLAAVGHPIAGDKKHGDFAFNREAKARWGLDRIFLHAAHLEFPHPQDGRRMVMESKLPAELRSVLRAAGVTS